MGKACSLRFLLSLCEEERIRQSQFDSFLPFHLSIHPVVIRRRGTRQ